MGTFRLVDHLLRQVRQFGTNVDPKMLALPRHPATRWVALGGGVGWTGKKQAQRKARYPHQSGDPVDNRDVAGSETDRNDGHGTPLESDRNHRWQDRGTYTMAMSYANSRLVAGPLSEV